MFEAIMTAKGQTTIPKGIRDYLNVSVGDRMTFTRLGDGTVILRAKTRNLADMAGFLQKSEQTIVPIEKMTPWK